MIFFLHFLCVRTDNATHKTNNERDRHTRTNSKRGKREIEKKESTHIIICVRFKCEG
jgi:hypothetical protein